MASPVATLGSRFLFYGIISVAVYPTFGGSLTYTLLFYGNKAAICILLPAYFIILSCAAICNNMYLFLIKLYPYILKFLRALNKIYPLNKHFIPRG